MKKEEIHLFDLDRILFGEVPAEFYIELIIRTVLVYAMIIFGMKYMGKRISAELDRTMLAAISTIAAATGLVILSPDRGLLPPVIVLVVILSIQWFVNRKNYNSTYFEDLTQGKRSVLVLDGVLQWNNMKKARVSKEQLFAQVRDAGVIHLGAVKRLYMEANGAFTFIEDPDPKPGLPAIPDWDTDFLKEQQEWHAWKVCNNCGHKQEKKEQQEMHCPECNNTVWCHPVVSPT